MTKPQVEVITSVQRRRRWPRAEKERIIAAAMVPSRRSAKVRRESVGCDCKSLSGSRVDLFGQGQYRKSWIVSQ